jgi:ribosomal protein S18 acetylase RimI-like enzyme
MEPSIRVITEEDVDCVFDMYVQLYEYLNQKGFVYKLNTSHLKENILDYINSKFTKIFVAELDNNILGFIMASVSKINSKFIFENTSYTGNIVDLFIKEESRGCSIGKLLIDEANRFFKEMNIKLVQVNTMVNNVGGINFYKKIGFKEDYISFISVL